MTMRLRRLAPIFAIVIIVLLIAVNYATPLGSILNPNGGVWVNAGDIQIGNSTFTLPGLQSNVKVIQDSEGVFHIYASNNHDLFYALGFVQAKERLWQMDIFRRAAIGQLAPVLGKSYASYDSFQLNLGLYVTAQSDWNRILGNASTNSTDLQSAQTLESYSQGINAYINYSSSRNDLPFMFKLLGYRPAEWTPVDSYAVQEYMIQNLEYGPDALLYTMFHYKMGNATSSLIPNFSPIPQVYYAGYNGPANSQVESVMNNTWMVNSTVASMVYTLWKEYQGFDLPHIFPASPPDHSNEWVISGNRTSTGNPILVGGPVLAFTLPPIWFQVQLVDPDYNVYGVVLPGAPVVVIGHNQKIAWTLTDVQAISWGTFFYLQNVSNGSYYYNGSWSQMSVHHLFGQTFYWTNLGPVMEEQGGLAIVMDWMGNHFTNDLGSLLLIMNSTGWTQFRSSLEIWKAPYQNFAFATSSMIADISPGYYPVFARGSSTPFNPGSLMPGDGQQYISGSIPYSSVPQVVNPAAGYLVSSNQRSVGPAYPYWFGSTMSFSAGNRADTVNNYLATHTDVSLADVMQLQQHNYTDFAAKASVPVLLSLLSNTTNSTVSGALQLLSSWNYQMNMSSQAATIWWFFYMSFFNNTVNPVMNKYGIYQSYSDIRFSGMSGSFQGTMGLASLDEDVIATLAYNYTGLISRASLWQVAYTSMLDAVRAADAAGSNLSWGSHYGFYFPSITGSKALSVGPLHSGGDFFTLNDASGVLPSNPATGGQSFTYVANLANISDSFGVYPGGQNGNPGSSQYDNYVYVWIKGQYLPLLYFPTAQSVPAGETLQVWTLKPGGA